MKGKIIVIKCWYIHCAACIKEFPQVNALVSKYKDRKYIVFVSLAEDTPEQLKTFLGRKPLLYSVIPNMKEYMNNALQLNSFPTHFIINKEGIISKVLPNFESLEVNNKLWIESAQITYAYSFPLWLLSKENKSKSEFNLVSFAPKYNKSEFQSNSVVNLPFAKEESEKICDVTNGSLFADNQATKSNFINSFTNYSIYHLAMHSYLYADDFEKSCLLFANNESLKHEHTSSYYSCYY